MLSVAAPLLGLLGGCSRDADACTPSTPDGCLAACDQKKTDACRVLGETLVRDGALKAGAMFLERACLAGDHASCGKLSSLPVALASASASARPAAPAPAPCPLASASASVSAATLGAVAAVAAASASAPAPAAASAPVQAAPVAPPAPAVIPSVPPGSSPEVTDLQGRCAKGEGVACTTLGDRLAEGVGVAASALQAIEGHAAGCERGDARGCRAASRELLARSRAPLSLERAVTLLKRGCLGADPGSCAALGDVALSGDYPALTPIYGVSQLRPACTNSHAPACRRLSQVLREGKLVPRDEDAAARSEGRSLELLDQSCQKEPSESCVLLGLWRERPGMVGETDEAPRTTDSASLDGAVDAFRKACDGGLPAGCSKAAAALEAQQKKAEAAVFIGKLEATCVAGDGASCVELIEATPPAQRASKRAALTKACELMIPRACVVLGEELLKGPDGGEAEGLLSRACSMGDAAGCGAYLRALKGAAPARLAEAQREVCLRLGGAPCAAVASAVRAGGDEGCAARLLARACAEAPERTAEGCAEVAEASPTDEAARFDEMACAAGLLEPPPLSPRVAASCGRHAQRKASSDAAAASAAAERACEAGDRVGCKVTARLLRKAGGDEARKRSEAAALKACKLGDAEACELRFGPLPSPAPSSSANIAHPKEEPPPLGCRLSPGASAGVGGSVWLLSALISLLRRRAR